MEVKPFQPLLASPAPADLKTLRFPVLASPKYDGVRIFVRSCTVLTRKLKPLKNTVIQHLLGRPEFDGLDGELIFGDPTAKDVFQKSQSGIKEGGGVDGAIFFPFDWIGAPEEPFTVRFEQVRRILGGETLDYHGLGISRPKHVLVRDVKELELLEEFVLSLGFEGLMLRDPEGVYKHGRSTTKEGILLKMKRFAHDEAEVLGAYEQMANTNDATVDERGYKKRSSHQAGMVGKGTLGGFHVRMLTGQFAGVKVDVGTGWTAAERDALWADYARMKAGVFNRVMGHLRVKHQLVGAKDKPRFPVADGWRSLEDMS